MMRNVIPFLSDGMFDPYFIVSDSAPKCSNDCKCDVNDYNPICLPELGGPIFCWSNLAMTYFLDELGLTTPLLRDLTRLKIYVMTKFDRQSAFRT